MIITIDGPVASGKSSTARLLASKLNVFYLNTGLFYRAVAYILFHRSLGIPLKNSFGQNDLRPVRDYNSEDQARAATLLRSIAITKNDLDQINLLRYDYAHNNCQDKKSCSNEKKVSLYYDHLDLTPFLTDRAIDQYASIIATDKTIRAALVVLQQNIGRRYPITIAEGRDCGSVVFPDAEIKFYITADIQTRALRLLHDPARAASNKSLNELEQEIAERDERDKTRERAPLVIPEGALIINNAHMTTQETVDYCAKIFIAYRTQNILS